MASIYNPTQNTRRNVKNGPYLIRRAQDVTLLSLTLNVSQWGNNVLRAVMSDGVEYTQRIQDPQDAFTLLDRPQLQGKKLNIIYRANKAGYTLRTTTSTYHSDNPTNTQARMDAAVKLQQGYYGRFNAALPLPNHVDGGYPVAYYTADGETLCAECATTQVKDNAQPDATVIDSEVLTGCDLLEGSAQDHGVVLCADCGVHIVDLDTDDEWGCLNCGAVNAKGDACQCGNTEQKQDAAIDSAAQAAAGQLTLPL